MEAKMVGTKTMKHHGKGVPNVVKTWGEWMYVRLRDGRNFITRARFWKALRWDWSTPGRSESPVDVVLFSLRDTYFARSGAVMLSTAKDVLDFVTRAAGSQLTNMVGDFTALELLAANFMAHGTAYTFDEVTKIPGKTMFQMLHALGMSPTGRVLGVDKAAKPDETVTWQPIHAAEPVRFDGKPTNPKDSIGIRKTPVSTVPANVVLEVGLAMLEGAAKYGRHNYRDAGVRASVYYDAAMGHLMDWWEGEDIDPDSGLSHVTKAIASLVVMRDAMMQDKIEDDRPPKSKKLKRDFNAMAGAILDRHKDKSPEHITERRMQERREKPAPKAPATMMQSTLDSLVITMCHEGKQKLVHQVLAQFGYPNSHAVPPVKRRELFHHLRDAWMRGHA